MDPPRKNKRTYCSPKLKLEDHFKSHTSDQFLNTRKSPQQAPHSKEQHTFPLNPIRENVNESTSETNKIKRTQDISYNIQKYGKKAESFDKKLLNLSHYTAANAQIFQSNVAYFPGKNLEELKQVLNSSKGNEILNEKLKIQNCNFLRKIVAGKREKVFGKHLITTKRKSRRMKINPQPLNPIEEVNESEKSNESLRKAPSQDQASSISISYSAATENVDKILTRTTRTLNKKRNVIEGGSVYSKALSKFENKESIYLFHKHEKEGRHVKTLVSESGNNNYERKHRKPAEMNTPKVFQIRDMFENMNKCNPTTTAKLKPKRILHSKIEEKQLHFNHKISCEECKKILKDLIEPDQTIAQNISNSTPDIPKDTTRQIIESLVDHISKKDSDSKGTISLKIETSTTTTISEFSFGKTRRKVKKKKKITEGPLKHYKNFLLLIFAISIVLYCFYCRLGERKR